MEIYCGDQSGVYKEPFKEFNVLPQDTLMWFLMANYRKLAGWRKLVAIIIKLVRHVLRKMGMDLFTIHTKNTAASLSKNGYDLIIAYAEGFSTWLAADIIAPRKIAWIHCEYDNLVDSSFRRKDKQAYEHFDKIVCVSEAARDSFVRSFPKFQYKTVVISNVFDCDNVRKLARDASNMDSRFVSDSSFKIISVGRVCAVKQYYHIPAIVSRIVQHEKVVWFIVGPGPEEEVNVVRKNIEEYDVGDSVVLLGAQENPYKYIARADMLAVTSSSEAYPTVINEAKALGIPIICTRFGSVLEMVNEAYCSISTIEEMSEKILNILRDRRKYVEMRSALKDLEFNNEALLKKIYSLIENYD